VSVKSAEILVKRCVRRSASESIITLLQRAIAGQRLEQVRLFRPSSIYFIADERAAESAPLELHVGETAEVGDKS
jgi:hypothetical protein